MGIKKIYSYTISLIVLALCSFQAEAQSEQDFQEKYLEAKAFLNNEQYRFAHELFGELSRAPEGHVLKPYASFYFAYAAYQMGRIQEAYNMFRQLQTKFPQWPNRDAVHYWLAVISFENKQYNSALGELRFIKREDLKEKGEEMAAYYLQQEDSAEILIDLYEMNKENRVIAERTAEVINQNPSIKNAPLLREIVETFILDPDRFALYRTQKVVMKEQYRVAVLMPFMSDKINPQQTFRGNQFVYELYYGMKLAQQDLAKRGIRVSLHAYDTRRSPEETEKILQWPEMKNMDLIVGPLFPEVTEIAMEFSKLHQINIINPVSTNEALINDNPFSFLFLSSIPTQMQKVASYVSEHILYKKVGQVYGDTKLDSVAAHVYRDEIERYGYEIALSARFSNDDPRQVLESFAEYYRDEEEVEELDQPPLDTLGHVFAYTRNELLAANVISAIDARQLSVPVIGNAEWLSFNSVSFEQLERIGSIFVYPGFINYQSDATQNFQQRYAELFNYPPSQYSFYGYELMNLWGNMMQKYGTYVQRGFSEEGFIPGKLMLGFDFSKSNDNHYVPLFKLEDLQLILLNGDERGIEYDQK